MANFCDFEFRVIGKKKAVKAFYESTPYLDWKDVEYEKGTDSNYEMHFKGNCKWSINFDVEDDCDGVTVDLSEETGVEYVGYSVRAKSEMFKCEVKVHYWSMESEFDQFDHYKNGECLKKRKIAFDNYGEEDIFDWDTLEFIGHEGEYDESVDGEQSDLDLMNMMSMMPGVTVPSQKPKKKAKKSSKDTSSSNKSIAALKEIKITRDSNKVIKGKGYTYIVPDGFEVGKEAGRDFIAWLPGSSSSSIDDAKIRIYPPDRNLPSGSSEEDLGKLVEYFQKSPQLCDAYQDYMCQLVKTQNPLGIKLNYEYFPTILSHTSGGCWCQRLTEGCQFLVKVLIGDHFEQFRFDIVGATSSNETAVQNFVRQLADGIIPNEPFNLPEPLNSEKYRSSTLTAGIVKEWSENFNFQLGLQSAVRNIRQKAIEEKIKFMASEGDIERDIIVDDIRRMAKEYLDVVVKLVEQAIDIIDFFSKQGANKTQVSKLRKETFEYLDNNREFSVNLDDEVIHEEIKQLNDFMARIGYTGASNAESRELRARQKAIEERKKARAEREKADRKAAKIASNIRSDFRNIKNTYERNANHHKRMIELHSFDGPWDPELYEYFSKFDDDIQELGSNAEKLLIEAIDSYNEINDVATPNAAIGIIEAIEKVIEYVEDACISNDDLGVSFKYEWIGDVPQINQELRRAKSELKRQQAALDREEKKQEEEDRRFEEAQKYGVPEKDLDKHKKYLSAKGKYQKAKHSKEFNAASKEFANVKGYLDADSLKAECDEKFKMLKPLEKAKEEFDKASQKYDDTKVKLSQLEDEYEKAIASRDKAVAKFNTKKGSYDKDRSDIEQAKDRIIADLESSVLDTESGLSAAKSDFKDASLELAKTFVLAFGKKKKLKNRICLLESTISSLEDSLKNLKDKLVNAKSEKAVSLKKLDKKLSDLEQNANKEKNRADEAEKKLNESKIECEKAKADLEIKKIAYDSIK